MWSSTFFNETRDRPVPCMLSREESLQLFGDNLIQKRRFWIARPVSVDSHEGIAECTSTRNSLHHRFSNFRTGRHGEVRLQNDYMPAFVAVLPIPVRCQHQYRGHTAAASCREDERRYRLTS